MINEQDLNDFKEQCEKGLKVYFDYRDEVNPTLLSSIDARKEEEEHCTYMEAFEDELFDWVNPNDNWYSREEDIKGICDEVNIDYDALDADDKDILRESFSECAYYEPDYDHYLKQDICVDIFIDSGDYNLDLGCNQIYPHYNGDKDTPIKDECVLVWLTKTQGYTKEQLKTNLCSRDAFTNRFFESVFDEVSNCTSHMNSLVFLKRMTLKEYFEILDNPDKLIHINKDTRCGLFDKWNGAGGVLDIQLEKDIDIDPANIHEVICDEMFKYNIHDVYGVRDSFWVGD